MAQGVTTGAITGTVTNEQGQPVDQAQITITNPRTGFSTNAATRENGRFFVQGLEVGGPYTVSARRIGMAPTTRTDVIVSLSQATRVDIQLRSQAVQLGGVMVEATRTEVFAPSNTGTRSIVSDTAIQRLPTLSRNLTDFIKMTPQASSTGAGFSGGGMSNRMNNVQIDGASERDVFGLGSTGTPGAEVGAKGISIDAVKEYQVLLAPFDVRQGNFGGLLLNAVTKSGTNTFEGTAYYYFRNQNYGADTSVLRSTKFNRAQYGFTVGGPIIKDKLHFFVAPELTEENTPVTGPYFGQTGGATPFPLIADTLTRFETIMQGLGATPGTPGYTNIPNPLANFFGRLDYQLNEAHRLVFRYNYSQGERLRQQNNRGSTTVVYSSNFHTFKNVKHAPVVQLFSNFKNGSFNELFVSYNNWYNRRTPEDQFPQITVNNVVGNAVTPVACTNCRIIAGADQFSQGNELDTKTWELTNNYTMPWKNHTFTVGTRNEHVWLRNLFTQSSYGVWSFRNLDSLAAGNPSTFRKAIILANGGNVEFSALQTALYAQDQWQITPDLTVTGGVRWDISSFLDDIKHNMAIDSAYGRSTSDIPERSIQFSPRIGFNWDLTGDLTNQLRGGVGLFVGTPPYVWLENAYINSGNIQTFLNCTTTATPAPAFNANPSGINTCRNGSGSAPIGDVNFLSSSLKFPQPLRASLAFDRRLPWDLIGTLEGLYSKTLNNFFFYNLNVQQPQTATAQGGRVIYHTAVNAANGATVVLLPTAVAANGGAARFSTAIDLKNQSEDYAYNLTAQLRKRYSNDWEAMVAYTYSQARDVQSFGSSTHISNYQFGRTLSGNQFNPYTGVSLFDQPHKLMASGTRTLHFHRKYPTDISFFYQGLSGSPHDYIYGGSGGAGDLNGDALQGNDLLYVPRNALDATEIQFRQAGSRTPEVQAQDFENFIKNSDCLKGQRGKIMDRNSCRLPFTNTVDVAFRQRLPVIRGQELALTLDIFNFGNLVNKKWGKSRISPLSGNSNVPLVTHVGYSTAVPTTAVPIVTFTPPVGGEYTNGNFVGNFWRTQMAVRYSF